MTSVVTRPKPSGSIGSDSPRKHRPSASIDASNGKDLPRRPSYHPARSRESMDGVLSPRSAGFLPNPPELDGVPDMSMLIYLEEPHVVHNVRSVSLCPSLCSLLTPCSDWIGSICFCVCLSKGTIQQGRNIHQHGQHPRSHKPIQIALHLWT